MASESTPAAAGPNTTQQKAGEPQFRTGTETGTFGGGGGQEGGPIPKQDNIAVSLAQCSPAQVVLVVLRALALVLTFIAAVVMGANKEDGLAATDISQLSYFVAANAIVCAYSLAPLLQPITFGALTRPAAVIFSVADLAAVALLFSGNGAAAAVGTFGCMAGEKFCSNLTAAVVMSMFAAVAYVAVLVLTLLGVHGAVGRIGVGSTVAP